MISSSSTAATFAAGMAYICLAGAAASVTLGTAAGSAVSNVFPPESTTIDSVLFPPESVVGFPGPTPTGVEPAVVQTAPAYPSLNSPGSQFPLLTPEPHGPVVSEDFDIAKYWGNLSPWFSVSSADYGLPDASPLAPEGCSVTQVQLLYRHGARYPTSGSAPSEFAEAIANATAAGTIEVSGELAFLANWTYKLGAELLTPFGRSQDFLLGVQHRQLYGHLLNNFTEAGTLPVFRTTSQDRMVKTAHNFAAGFFGVPEYLDQVNIEIVVENEGVNNSGAPYEVCPNSDVSSRGNIGGTLSAEYGNNAFNATLARLNSQISGLNFTTSHIAAMLELCSYETVALGYSAFCPLFTTEDFLNYEYSYDLDFYYNNGPGSPVAAAQGKSYLQEFVARFLGEYPEGGSSALNGTYDNSSTYFPLNSSLYADASHEVVIMDTLMAFNLTALFNGPPLSVDGNTAQNSFVASKIVPFGTHFLIQALECESYSPTKQMRFIVNDAVVPVSDSYSGCPEDPNGLCPFHTVMKVLQDRIDEIDFEHDCFGNYTAMPGVDYNGRAPKS
ncbi:phosphoglycerate mutase-like protein [Xylariaceae sp. FL0255]|nr:phosphoglycerate mutase-like protein [Xylariaceae sp. FL0255]